MIKRRVNEGKEKGKLIGQRGSAASEAEEESRVKQKKIKLEKVETRKLKAKVILPERKRVEEIKISGEKETRTHNVSLRGEY